MSQVPHRCSVPSRGPEWHGLPRGSDLLPAEAVPYAADVRPGAARSHNRADTRWPPSGRRPPQNALVFFIIPSIRNGTINKSKIFKINNFIIFPAYPRKISPIIDKIKKTKPNKIYCCILPFCILSNFVRNFSSHLIIGFTIYASSMS